MPKKQDVAVTEQQTDQEVVATSQQKETKNPVAVIYMGPAIVGVAVPGTVYRNGLPPQLENAVKELPTLKRLLVETGKAQQIRKDLKDPQSAVSICCQSALEYAKKKGAKG